jgi:hypothetical protein
MIEATLIGYLMLCTTATAALINLGRARRA